MGGRFTYGICGGKLLLVRFSISPGEMTISRRKQVPQVGHKTPWNSWNTVLRQLGAF